MQLLGRAVRDRRLELQMTQQDLAMLISADSGQAYISRIEAGAVGIGVDVLLRIADALDTRVSDLTNGF